MPPNNMDIDTPLLLKPSEAASLLGLSRSQVYRLMADGRLPATRQFGPWRILYRNVVELLERAGSPKTMEES